LIEESEENGSGEKRSEENSDLTNTSGGILKPRNKREEEGK